MFSKLSMSSTSVYNSFYNIPPNSSTIHSVIKYAIIFKFPNGIHTLSCRTEQNFRLPVLLFIVVSNPIKLSIPFYRFMLDLNPSKHLFPDTLQAATIK